LLAVDDWKNPHKRIGRKVYCIFRVYGEKKPLDGSRPNFVWL